jgi:hypothetical protein
MNNGSSAVLERRPTGLPTTGRRDRTNQTGCDPGNGMRLPQRTGSATPVQTANNAGDATAHTTAQIRIAIAAGPPFSTGVECCPTRNGN